VDFDAIKIGMPLEMILIPLDPDAAEPVWIYAFQPIGASA
jgi:hypothetical protein